MGKYNELTQLGLILLMLVVGTVMLIKDDKQPPDIDWKQMHDSIARVNMYKQYEADTLFMWWMKPENRIKVKRCINEQTN